MNSLVIVLISIEAVVFSLFLFAGIKLMAVKRRGTPDPESETMCTLKTRCGLSADQVAFNLRAINFAEGGDNSAEFYEHVDMPDGGTAADWIEEWSELREQMEGDK